MPEIIWRGEWPPEGRSAVEPILRRYLYIVPPWCRRVYMRWSEPDGNTVGTTVVEQHRRWISVRINLSTFLGCPELEREEIIAHELCHALLNPLDQFVVRLTELYARDKAEKFIDAEWENRLEAVNEDLASMLVERRRMSDRRGGP